MHHWSGPTGLLHGMAQPRAWVETLTLQLTTIPLQATAITGRLPTGLWSVRLTLAAYGLSPMQVVLVPYPDRVRMTLWTSIWAAIPPPREAQYLALMTVARWLIGIAQQRDGSPVMLILPPTRCANTSLTPAWWEGGRNRHIGMERNNPFIPSQCDIFFCHDNDSSASTRQWHSLLPPTLFQPSADA